MLALSGPEIREALEELSIELSRANVKARLYLAGGAAIALAFRASRRTYDLDALILEGHGPLIEAVRRVAGRRGWPQSWLNEQAVASMPKSPDLRARTLFGTSSLVVTGASAEHLLAMKVRAGRVQDLEDIAVLCEILGIESERSVLEVHDRVFPDSRVPPRAMHAVRRFLAKRWPSDGANSTDSEPDSAG